MTRITLLKTLSIAAGAVCVASAMPNSAQAATIGFDDLSTANLASDVPNGYRGFNWDLFYADASSPALQGNGIERGVVSRPTLLLSQQVSGGVLVFRAAPHSPSIVFTSQHMIAAVLSIF
jgi:hypothetical protein